MNRCPYCHTRQQQVKTGFNPSGSQRYLCKQCNRVYTPMPMLNGYPKEVRVRAVTLYQDGLSFRAIGRILGVGPQTIANWVNASTNED